MGWLVCIGGYVQADEDLQMNDVVNTVLSDGISVCIEVSKRVIGAAVHSQIHLANIVIYSRRRLRPADWAGVVAIAHTELIVIASEGFQAGGFDFHRIIHIAGCVSLSTVYYLGEILCRRDLVVYANWCCRNSLFRAVPVERDIACNRTIVVHGVVLWRHASPEDDRV